jgi:hypothetical protein
MLNPEDRLRLAKRDMDALRRMESPNARVLMSGGNVVLPNENERTDINLSPEKFIIKMLGPTDDDIRLRIGNTVLFDPKRGADKPFQRDKVFRSATITRSEAIAAGADWKLGATVNVDTFDAFPNYYASAPWFVTIILNGGSTSRKTGGSTVNGKSLTQISLPAPAGYYSGGPKLNDYHPNGSFTLS